MFYHGWLSVERKGLSAKGEYKRSNLRIMSQWMVQQCKYQCLPKHVMSSLQAGLVKMCLLQLCALKIKHREWGAGGGEKAKTIYSHWWENVW